MPKDTAVMALVETAQPAIIRAPRVVLCNFIMTCFVVISMSLLKNELLLNTSMKIPNSISSACKQNACRVQFRLHNLLILNGMSHNSNVLTDAPISNSPFRCKVCLQLQELGILHSSGPASQPVFSKSSNLHGHSIHFALKAQACLCGSC